jgi:hypothetical protein
MKDTKEMTALHIATQRGNENIVSLIVSRCPDCYELVDNRGWNVLHFTIKRAPYFRSEGIIEILNVLEHKVYIFYIVDYNQFNRI